MIIIPARLKSSRLKNKCLVDIHGLPMIVRTAKNAEKVDETIVACDDLKIVDVLIEHNIKYVITDKDHKNGTERLCEAAKILELNEEDTIINIQGDEPFLEVDTIKAIKELSEKRDTNGDRYFIYSLYKKANEEEAIAPSNVKVVTNIHEEALYFSRSVIPFDRNKEMDLYYKIHLGVYAYSVKNLFEFASMKSAFIEDSESLEQLRALYNGKKIVLKEVNTKSFGIDTEDDLKLARKLFNKKDMNA